MVDFYCARANLVVEIDGSVHDLQLGRDAERTSKLEQQGYRVIRFTNAEVEQDIENILQRIIEACNQ